MTGTIISLLLYGVFWALETERRDCPENNIIWNWARKSDRLSRWYIGGNFEYNPSYPWTSDMCHMAIWGRLLSLVCAICFATDNWFWFLMFFPVGQVFVILYHYILKSPPDGNWKTYLKGLFYFGNWHKQ